MVNGPTQLLLDTWVQSQMGITAKLVQILYIKISFLDIVLNNNIKLYMKDDQAYTCNLQP